MSSFIDDYPSIAMVTDAIHSSPTLKIGVFLLKEDSMTDNTI